MGRGFESPFRHDDPPVITTSPTRGVDFSGEKEKNQKFLFKNM
jgi:hypothetical protein